MREYAAYIYYVHEINDPNKAFERAARFAASKHDVSTTIVRFFAVRTESDFTDAWNKIFEEAAINLKIEVSLVNIYTHASSLTSSFTSSNTVANSVKTITSLSGTGLEFAKEDGAGKNSDSTLKQSDILALPVLPWSSTGEINLYGCNSGLPLLRGWSPAEAFARRQKVRTTGQKGVSSFSRKSTTYEMITSSDTEVYLLSFNKGANAPFFGELDSEMEL